MNINTEQLMHGGLRGICLNFCSMVFSLNFQLNAKRYIPKVFLSPFVHEEGIAIARRYAIYHPIPPHFKLCYISITQHSRVNVDIQHGETHYLTCTQYSCSHFLNFIISLERIRKTIRLSIYKPSISGKDRQTMIKVHVSSLQAEVTQCHKGHRMTLRLHYITALQV